MEAMCETREQERLRFENRAKKILSEREFVSLACVNREGYPRVCEMEVVKAVGLSEIYFTTVKKSEKVIHFRANDKAGVSFSGDADSVSLIGHVEIVEDMETKKAIWQGGHTKRFVEENGEPKYCILKFKTAEGRFLVDGEKRTFSI